MADPNQPMMFTYRCPNSHVGRVRELLEIHRPAGVRFEEQPAHWWARLFGNGAMFSIRCPAFFVDQLHRNLADPEVLRQAPDS
ncbi:MAG: hypothetical protein JWQ76_860 [Ramlibacter sp.]|nr:hypothetical protein [Ramlibacter sp.]